MKDKILKIQNTEINFRKSLKAKNISIRIKPFEGVLVTVPRFLSFKIANVFVKSKMNWIGSESRVVHFLNKFGCF